MVYINTMLASNFSVTIMTVMTMFSVEEDTAITGISFIRTELQMKKLYIQSMCLPTLF